MFFVKTFQKLKKISAKIRSDAFLLYLCFKDKRTPRSAKIISLIALGLAFSPIDLIPDFIPVLGYLDDIIIIPLLIYIAFRLIPEDIISVNRSLAEKPGTNNQPVFKAAGFIIIILWLPGIVLIGYNIFKCLNMI